VISTFAGLISRRPEPPPFLIPSRTVRRLHPTLLLRGLLLRLPGRLSLAALLLLLRALLVRRLLHRLGVAGLLLLRGL